MNITLNHHTPATREQDMVEQLLDSLDNNTYALVIHNDEVNTFEWVIVSLMDICQHTWLQAEQCSLIIHHKGKYAVKEGEEAPLQEMRRAFAERGIGATVETL